MNGHDGKDNRAPFTLGDRALQDVIPQVLRCNSLFPARRIFSLFPIPCDLVEHLSQLRR